MNAAPLLEVRDLERRFGGVRAIAGVNFRLDRGELRCLIGPNGAGKSTFFKMLTAQLHPTSGHILFDGMDITRKEPHEISRLGIGIKNQVPSVFDRLTVRANLLLSGIARHPRPRARHIAEAVMARLDLGGVADVPVGSLSHGQRQWVEFGMVIALEPRLILLDEPTAGMSQEEVNRAAALIRDLSRGASIIVVEHDMQFIHAIAGTVTVFHQGRILVEDTMAKVQNDPRVRDVYLGRPDA
jgi:branched-chain amino acid transport system ATP-binding protein/urea transport system ATP-binding protein